MGFYILLAIYQTLQASCPKHGHMKSKVEHDLTWYPDAFFQIMHHVDTGYLCTWRYIFLNVLPGVAGESSEGKRR